MDIYGTAHLEGVLASLEEPNFFLLDQFFTNVQTEEDENIHFDIEEYLPRISPFVAPEVPGKVVERKGFQTKTFTPANVKDTRVHKPKGALKRVMGEQLNGSLSAADRRLIHLANDMQDQLEMLTRREMVMASESLIYGKVTVEGDNYPKVVVDFGRDASLTKTLSGVRQWTDFASSDPLQDFEDNAEAISDIAGGSATTVIMDNAAFALMKKSESLKERQQFFWGTNMSLSTDPIAQGTGDRKARFRGRIGDFDIWTYQEGYRDDAGVLQKVMPANGFIQLDPFELEGTRAYGLIHDEDLGLQAERYATKSWTTPDPSVRWLLLQSAPLVFPKRPNVTSYTKVVA